MIDFYLNMYIHFYIIKSAIQNASLHDKITMLFAVLKYVFAKELEVIKVTKNNFACSPYIF